MNVRAQRHHWLNTVVGLLDSSFYLSDEEQLAVTGIVQRVLDYLQIPERGDVSVMPAPVSQEVVGGYYSLGMASPREAGVVRAVRPATDQDIVVKVETWRDALVGLFTTAYPALSADELLLLTKVFHDLLGAIGAPARVAAHLPDVVVDAFREFEARG